MTWGISIVCEHATMCHFLKLSSNPNNPKAAGLYPMIGRVDRVGGKTTGVRTAKGDAVRVHPSSVNAENDTGSGMEVRQRIMVIDELTRGDAGFLCTYLIVCTPFCSRLIVFVSRV